jgi:hypothetical protein
MKRCSFSREEGTFQRLGEGGSFLVYSAYLGEADMSCWRQLCSMSRCLLSFVTPLVCAISTHPLLSMLKIIVPMRSTCFPSVISPLRLVVDKMGCGAERDLPCVAEPLKQGEIPGCDVGGDKFSLCG